MRLLLRLAADLSLSLFAHNQSFDVKSKLLIVNNVNAFIFFSAYVHRIKRLNIISCRVGENECVCVRVKTKYTPENGTLNPSR